MRLACYFLMCNHFVLISWSKLSYYLSDQWMLSAGTCLGIAVFLCFTLHKPAYMCDGCIMLVKDCECSNEKLKQNQSTVLDSYAYVIKLVIYFDL